jgi:hypothetical protein
MIALGGALPASAAPAAHHGVHVTMTRVGTGHAISYTSPGYYNISFELTSGSSSCTATAQLEFYKSSYGYWNIKITAENNCLVNGNPLELEAAATCSGYNFWGSPAVYAGDYTIASCDSAHPTFQHGGWRIDVNGTWYYYTERITPA